MKIHDVCVLCRQSCKQPWSQWDDSRPEKAFCKNFQHIEIQSKLPIETLDSIIEEAKTKLSAESPAHEFLKELRKIYIPCSKCSHMIAPDELYYIENEEAVCAGCVE